MSYRRAHWFNHTWHPQRQEVFVKSFYLVRRRRWWSDLHGRKGLRSHWIELNLQPRLTAAAVAHLRSCDKKGWSLGVLFFSSSSAAQLFPRRRRHTIRKPNFAKRPCHTRAIQRSQYILLGSASQPARETTERQRRQCAGTQQAAAGYCAGVGYSGVECARKVAYKRWS